MAEQAFDGNRCLQPAITQGLEHPADYPPEPVHVVTRSRALQFVGNARKRFDMQSCIAAFDPAKQRELELAEAVRAKDHTLAELTIVLEAIDYGVLLLDSDLRIRVSNRKYRQLWNIPETFFARHPTLQEDMEYTRANGLYRLDDGSWSSYIQARCEEIRGGDIPPRELSLANGTTADAPG